MKMKTCLTRNSLNYWSRGHNHSARPISANAMWVSLKPLARKNGGLVSNIFSATVVILRIYAAYILVNTSLSTVALFVFIGKFGKDQTVDTYMAATGLSTLTLLLLASFVLIYAKKIGCYITRDLENGTTEFNETNYEILQAIGFSLLGMYLLMHTIPVIVKIVASYAFPAPNNKYEVSLMPSGYKVRVPLPDILEVLVQLGLGLWLLIGAKGLAAAVKLAWVKGKTL